ncbi:hypothetical protein KGO06_00345 [Patescibacteria group bacterium]|nr:hypothetical protein [Patescibacteria group bacterium]
MDTSLKPKVGPKDFFLWLGAIVALYTSVFAFLTLAFEYVNTAFPDALSYSYDPYSGAIKFAIATLIVAFPLFLVLMRLIRMDIARTPEKSDLWVRRWALYLTIFIAGATIAIDLVTLVYYFLDGEITTRFVLKVLVVLLVASAGLMHFLSDIWGYWVEYPARAMYVGWAVAVLIVGTVVSGFLIIGSPMDARLYKMDEQKVYDLQSIQGQILYHYQSTGVLPEALAELSSPLSGYSVPISADGTLYEYRIGDADSFELCAMFNKASRTSASMPVRGANDFWEHGEGLECFARTIDHDLYPVIDTAKVPVPNR